MGWISPTSHLDPDSQWNTEANAYDGSTSTLAMTNTNAWQHWLELILSSNIFCDKIRLFAAQFSGIHENVIARIEVYDLGISDWLLVFDGEIAKQIWVEKEIPGGQIMISKARVWWSAKWGMAPYASMRLFEFEFNEISVASRPLIGGSLAAGRKGLVA